MKYPLPLLALLLPAAVSAADMQDCIGCHREKTPAAVRQWEESAHGKRKIGCDVCHGKDHDAILAGKQKVTMKICAPCHAKAYGQHLKSRHGMGLHSGWGCTRNMSGRNQSECVFCHEEGSTVPKSNVQCSRFLKQSSEMGEIGCNACHMVESYCSSCHTNHLTDLKIVRDPASCAKCHMGPDHPQWEMWQTSLHGTLYANQGEKFGPNCQTCHMPEGDHDVSRGITVTSGGIPLPEAISRPNRALMRNICIRCHGGDFVNREFARDDAVLRQSLKIVKEAEEIIWDLHDKGLLDPMPDNRPPHPLSGSKLVTDTQLLYEDTSHIERLLFKMKKYDYAKTIKGAYHQNPAYTHWYGNAELKMDLVDIRAEASRLKARAGATRGEEKKPSPEERLLLLKKKLERGALTQAEYEKEKAAVLEELKTGK